MKKEIHPKYEMITIKCACGNEVQVRDTVPGFTVDICNVCHPFFTGKQKLVDSAGRVERFRKRYGMGDDGSTAAVIDEAKKRREDKGVKARGKVKPEPKKKEKPIVIEEAKVEKRVEEKPEPRKEKKPKVIEKAKVEKAVEKKKTAETKAKEKAVPEETKKAPAKKPTGKVVATSSGKYHKSDCRYAKGGEEITKNAAKKQGLEPCGVCKP